MSNSTNIITIDGPAGVGKSTVSRRVAAATGFTYLDTGAMYRGVGLFLQDEKVDFQDYRAIQEKLATLDLGLTPAATEDSDVGVRINGRDVSHLIRTPEMSMVASEVSAIVVVREVLTSLQRRVGENGNIVAEGRDIGTVVFPQAAFKFYLDAKPEERAQRRYSQLQAKGESVDYDELLAMTIERDKQDSEREVAPLKPAEDATIIDTTDIGIDEVVTQVMARVSQTVGKKN